jgi:hypothetical protein
MAGFAEFGPQNSAMVVLVGIGAAHGITAKGASTRSNFVWSVWLSDGKPRSWSILSLAEWIDSM